MKTMCRQRKLINTKTNKNTPSRKTVIFSKRNNRDINAKDCYLHKGKLDSRRPLHHHRPYCNKLPPPRVKFEYLKLRNTISVVLAWSNMIYLISRHFWFNGTHKMLFSSGNIDIHKWIFELLHIVCTVSEKIVKTILFSIYGKRKERSLIFFHCVFCKISSGCQKSRLMGLS